MKTLRVMSLLFVSILTLAGLSARAEDDSNLLIFSNEPSAQAVSSEVSQDIEIRLDPSEVQTPKDATFDREAFIARARATMKNEIPKDAIYNFETPRTEAELDKLMQMDDSEIVSFLAKKQAFINKFAKVLSFFRLGPGKINKALNELNNRFYESSHVVAKSNSKGAAVMFSLSGGLALPQKVMTALRARNIGNFIPDSGGFYYMLGLGAGFSRQIGPDGKSKFVFEIFMDVEKLKSTLTGLVEVSAAGTYGLVFEKREGAFATQKSKVMYGGATGVFRQGSEQFGWAASTGLSFPPGIGAILVYQDTSTRYYLFRAEGLKAMFPALRLIRDNVISGLKSIVFNRGAVVRCEGVLQ